MTRDNLTIDGLKSEFNRLRRLWQQDWVGLPALARESACRLGHRNMAELDTENRAVHDCIVLVADAIEVDGKLRQQRDEEPAYHNRLHIADTLCSLTCLLLATRAGQGRALDDAPLDIEWLMLLAMVGHDFLHSGQINRVPGEIEARSVTALLPLMEECGVSDAGREIVSELILMTDPARVRPNHEAFRGKAFDLAEPTCRALLLQESDILASAMPDIGIALTHQLADEWSRFSEGMAGSLLSTRSRIKFLREFALFSSPASQWLGLHDMKAAEIDALELIAADTPI